MMGLFLLYKFIIQEEQGEVGLSKASVTKFTAGFGVSDIFGLVHVNILHKFHVNVGGLKMKEKITHGSTKEDIAVCYMQK